MSTFSVNDIAHILIGVGIFVVDYIYCEIERARKKSNEIKLLKTLSNRV